MSAQFLFPKLHKHLESIPWIYQYRIINGFCLVLQEATHIATPVFQNLPIMPCEVLGPPKSLARYLEDYLVHYPSHGMEIHHPSSSFPKKKLMISSSFLLISRKFWVFIMVNPIKMDDLGENPLFSETSIWYHQLQVHLQKQLQVQQNTKNGGNLNSAHTTWPPKSSKQNVTTTPTKPRPPGANGTCGATWQSKKTITSPTAKSAPETGENANAGCNS